MVIKKYCGIWGIGQSKDIPQKYLPQGCKCDYVYKTVTGGGCYH